MRRLFGAGIIAAALVLHSPRVAADARTDKAREHYLQGDAYYKLDKFREALGQYEQAYIAKADPSFLYNIAQCHRLMGNRPDAIKFYKRFLKDHPQSPNRGIAEKHIRELESALDKTVAPLITHAPPPPAPAPPAGLAGSEGRPQPAPAAPAPTPTLALSSPAAEREAAQGAALNAPTADQAPDDEKSGPVYTRWWFWTAIGVVAAGAVLVAVTASGSDCESGRTCK